MQFRVIWLCPPCHRPIHAILTEKQLAHGDNSREALLAHPDVARLVAWIADKPAALEVRSRDPRR